MAQEDWFADLIASAQAVPHRDVGLVVCDGRTGEVLASNDRAAEVLGAPVPASAFDLADQGLVSRPDLGAFQAQVRARRRSIAPDQRETAHAWSFELRVHPPGSASRVVHVDAVHHHRRYDDDAEAVILLIGSADAAPNEPEPAQEAWSDWALYDFQMRLLAYDPLSVLSAREPALGVLAAALVSPDDLPSNVRAVTPVIDGSCAAARYSSNYIWLGDPVVLDAEARAVTGSGPYGQPLRRYLIVATPATRYREPIVPGMVTDRQVDVLDAIFAGQRPQQIAHAQGVSVSTIRFHLAAAYKALGVAGRDELVDRYHPPCLVEEPVTVSITEEGGERFPIPAGPPGTIGTTETRRLRSVDGEIEVALTRWSAGSDRTPIPPGLLSKKEAAVVAALFDGLRPAAIAERQGTSVKTVRNQLSSAYDKLAVDGQAALTATYERPST